MSLLRMEDGNGRLEEGIMVNEKRKRGAGCFVVDGEGGV